MSFSNDILNNVCSELDILVKKDKDNITIELYKECGSRFFLVGWIKLVYLYDWRTKNYFLETHSFTSERFRGAGFGVYLYSLGAEYAFERNLPIRSSIRRSVDAQRLWKSSTLRKLYDIRRVGSSASYRWEIFSKVIIKNVA